LKIARLRVKTLRELAREFDDITLGLEGDIFVKDAGMSTINRSILGRTVLGHPSADGTQYILLCYIDNDRAKQTLNSILYKEYVQILAEGEI